VPDIAGTIAAGIANPWLYLPVAVLLGALHALEPGHSKSIMAAFLVTVRGTPTQALLLGVSAAIGHTIVVWALVLIALWIGSETIEQQAYPWLVLLSGLLILLIAGRLLWSMRRPSGHHGHDHPRDHAHHHEHGGDHAHDHSHDHGPDGTCHGHRHMGEGEIAARFAGRPVRSWEIIWFGFTGGLLPCPSAIAVLLVALQINAYALGVAMVAAFSLGLAATLVAVGVAAVWGARKLSDLGGFDRIGRHVPLLSAGIVLLLGLGVVWHALGLLRAG
jgi:nickel/cobalt exporter